jgi:hypothetical protein
MGESDYDRLVIEWAGRYGYPCTYDSLTYEGNRCVRVCLTHVTAHMWQGKLVRLLCRDDGLFTGEIARELAVLFALCGYLELVRADSAECCETKTDRARDHQMHTGTVDP